jgi:hypothetical protein
MIKTQSSLVELEDGNHTEKQDAGCWHISLQKTLGTRTFKSSGSLMVHTMGSPFKTRSAFVRKIVDLKRYPKEAVPKMKWHGYVTEILADGFVASFQTTERDKNAVIAEFDFDELAEDDQAILNIGAPLVWAIFTEREKGGLKNSSTLYVRRIIPPAESTIQATTNKLHEWFANLGDDASPER